MAVTVDSLKGNKFVYFEDGYIVINVHYEYNIAIERINTPEKLLFWVYHLSEKNWVTKQIIRDVVKLAIEKMNIKIGV